MAMEHPTNIQLIEDASGLPPWFNISDYSALKQFKYQQWVNVIGERYDLYQRFINGEPANNIEFWNKTEYSYFTGQAGVDPGRFQLHPVSSFPELTYHSIHSLSLQEAIELTSKNSIVMIDPMARDLAGIEESMFTNATYTTVNNYDDVIDHRDKSYDLFLYKMNYRYHSKANLVIDMDASNNQILADIEKWLIEFRIKAKKPEVFAEHVYEDRHASWYVWNVIPYLDLYIWGLFHNVKFSNTLMAKTIFAQDFTFPNDLSTVIDTLRRSTMPTADLLLHDTGFRSIFLRDQESAGAKNKPKKKYSSSTKNANKSSTARRKK